MTKEEAANIISGYEVYGCGYCLQGGDEVEEALKLAVDALKELPTVEAEPVRHGRWACDEGLYTEGCAQCSVCKTTFYEDDLYCVGEKAQSELPNYCPHCGAKMDEMKEE